MASWPTQSDYKDSLQNPDTAFRDPDLKQSQAERSPMGVPRARSGALVHINNTRRCVYGYDQRLEVFGAEGMLLAGNHTATTVQSFTGKHTGAADLLLHTFIERYPEAYAAEVDHFVECLHGGITPLTNFRDGIEALRLAEAALESMHTGRTVKLD